jgi:hypothetical protein
MVQFTGPHSTRRICLLCPIGPVPPFNMASVPLRAKGLIIRCGRLFFSIATTCPYRLCGPPPLLLVMAELYPTSEVGKPMGHSYVAPIMFVVIYERGVPGGALSLKSTNYPDQGHHGDRPL